MSGATPRDAGFSSYYYASHGAGPPQTPTPSHPAFDAFDGPPSGRSMPPPPSAAGSAAMGRTPVSASLEHEFRGVDERVEHYVSRFLLRSHQGPEAERQLTQIVQAEIRDLLRRTLDAESEVARYKELLGNAHRKLVDVRQESDLQTQQGVTEIEERLRAEQRHALEAREAEDAQALARAQAEFDRQLKSARDEMEARVGAKDSAISRMRETHDSEISKARAELQAERKAHLELMRTMQAAAEERQKERSGEQKLQRERLARDASVATAQRQRVQEQVAQLVASWERSSASARRIQRGATGARAPASPALNIAPACMRAPTGAPAVRPCPPLSPRRGPSSSPSRPRAFFFRGPARGRGSLSVAARNLPAAAISAAKATVASNWRADVALLARELVPWFLRAGLRHFVSRRPSSSGACLHLGRGRGERGVEQRRRLPDRREQVRVAGRRIGQVDGGGAAADARAAAGGAAGSRRRRPRCRARRRGAAPRAPPPSPRPVVIAVLVVHGSGGGSSSSSSSSSTAAASSATRRRAQHDTEFVGVSERGNVIEREAEHAHNELARRGLCCCVLHARSFSCAAAR